MTRRLIIFPPDYGGSRILGPWFPKTVEFLQIDRLDNDIVLTPDDVVLFEGGTDINPELYGEKPGRYTHISDRRRDNFEVYLFQKAVKAGAAMFGICRGAQLFCALNEGTLIQHVSGHAGSAHEIETSDGKKMRVPSVHHQMMAPNPKSDFKLIAWSSHAQSRAYLDGENKDCKEKLAPIMYLEPEIIWFPKTRGLGIQSHPEYCDPHHPLVKYSLELIKKYIWEEKNA